MCLSNLLERPAGRSIGLTMEAVMSNKIEYRLWLEQAKSLPVGSDAKIIHKGCGSRESLFIKNEEDSWWCFCHRCKGSGRKDKTLQRVKMKLPSKTGWKPDKLIPLVEAVASEPYNFSELFRRFGLAPYTSLLTFSPDTRRIYFPDDSGSLVGLDATFEATARFYSPYKRGLATWFNPASNRLVVVAHVTDYLAAVHAGMSAVWITNGAGAKAALAEVSNNCTTHTHIYTVGIKRDGPIYRDFKPFLKEM